MKRKRKKGSLVNGRRSMQRFLEKEISKGNLIDLVGQWFYQLGYVKESEIITNIEIADNGGKTFEVSLTIEKELEVKLIEHHGKKLSEGNAL